LKKDYVFPSCHEELDDLGARNLDDLFHIGRSKWDTRCFYFEGDPIYDIDYEGENEIGELGHYKEFNLEKMMKNLMSKS
jgi:hypothetical protein